jgi:hypothetical protein
MMLSGSEVCNVEWGHDLWMMNWKRFGGKRYLSDPVDLKFLVHAGHIEYGFSFYVALELEEISKMFV